MFPFSSSHLASPPQPEFSVFLTLAAPSAFDFLRYHPFNSHYFPPVLLSVNPLHSKKSIYFSSLCFYFFVHTLFSTIFPCVDCPFKSLESWTLDTSSQSLHLCFAFFLQHLLFHIDSFNRTSYCVWAGHHWVPWLETIDEEVTCCLSQYHFCFPKLTPI